jgi:Spy/CpxP family protein refolding chaperone
MEGGELDNCGIMKRLLSLALVLAVFLSVPTSLLAQRRMIRVKTILDYKDELKLTNDQVEKIKAYLFDLERKRGELRRRLTSVNREILDLLRQWAEKQGSLNLGKVEKKIREAYQIRADMAIAEIETAEKINEVLTPGQYEKWKKIRSRKRVRKR